MECSVSQAAVKHLPQTLHWFLADGWGYLGAAKCETELVDGLFFLQHQGFSFTDLIHLLPGTDVVFTVRSSIKALIGGCWTLDLVRGPLH